MIKVSIYQKAIVILNVYSTNKSATKTVKQKLVELKVEVDQSTNIVGYPNTLRQKINKDIELN